MTADLHMTDVLAIWSYFKGLKTSLIVKLSWNVPTDLPLIISTSEDAFSCEAWQIYMVSYYHDVTNIKVGI